MNLNVIIKMKFGSHLYGTAIPRISDMDYKGVFMPSSRQILLGRIPKSCSFNSKTGSSKNTSEDTDIEFYSLHYFIDLACKGETVALDMLHAPPDMVLETSKIWQEIVAMRSGFYTKNLKSFVGYARRQSSKYGIKGSRINDVKKVIDFLNQYEGKIFDVWDQLPQGEHIFKYPPNENGVRLYEVCGRKVGETVSVSYALDVFNKVYQEYGKRAELAATNQGIDWKAISHCLRAAYQVEEILTQGTITFPLRQANFLKDVKSGKYNFQAEIVPIIDELMTRIERLSQESDLPESVDRKFWDNYLYLKVVESLRG